MKYNRIIKSHPGDTKFFLGNEAIVRGALESGIDVFTYYPGTPSSEVGAVFTEIFKEVGMSWAETSINEKVAMEIAGAAYARGAKAMVAMKNVGLNVASDPLFAISTTKPKNPDSALVILVADDPQAHSSAVEMDSRNYLQLFKIPALEPSDPQECLDFTKEAFDISKTLKLPVIIRTVTMVSHARSNVITGEIKRKELSKDFDLSKEVNVASRLYFLDLKDDQIYNRMNKALQLSEESPLNKVVNLKGEKKYQLGVITSGVSYHYTLEALDFLDISVPILKLGFINPLPTKLLIEFLQKFDEVLIVEEMDAFIEKQILAIAKTANIDTKIYGKAPFSYSKDQSLLPFVGELNPTKVISALKKLRGDNFKPETDDGNSIEIKSMRRLPIMCSGCPHRTTGHALKDVINKIKSSKGVNAYFYQDIGCYTMLSYPPLGFANVKYCMGSSIATAQGVAHTSNDLNVAIIGDGTFFHAGIPALINAVHHKAPILILILDNGWIGMTGQQPHPGSNTNYYEEGIYKEYIDLESLLIGTGANVSIIEHNFKSESYLKRLKNLIHDKCLEVLDNQSLQIILIKDECIQKTVKRNIPNLRKVNLESCNNCGLCHSQFACPSISLLEDCVIIDSNSCLGCGICEEICPNKAIIMEGE